MHLYALSKSTYVGGSYQFRNGLHVICSDSGRIDRFTAVLDLVHLGLGPDGHHRFLLPGDRVLDIKDTDVAVTRIYQKRRRMTLTYPIINRSGRVLWLVTGSEKAGMLARLHAGDVSIPAGHVARTVPWFEQIVPPQAK